MPPSESATTMQHKSQVLACIFSKMISHLDNAIYNDDPHKEVRPNYRQFFCSFHLVLRVLNGVRVCHKLSYRQSKARFLYILGVLVILLVQFLQVVIMCNLSFFFQARIVCLVLASPSGEAAKCNASLRNLDALRGDMPLIVLNCFNV